MIKRLILTLLSLLLISSSAFATLKMRINAIDPPKLRGAYSISIPKGAFFKAILQENISTSTNNRYDTITAIIPTNFYALNEICIPKNSVFEGEVSELEAPKKGRHGLFKVSFNKIQTPSGEDFPIKASLWVKGSSQIGGTPSSLGEIRVIPNRVQNLSNVGYLSVVKTGEYNVGKDVSIKAGTEIIIKLNETLDIKL